VKSNGHDAVHRADSSATVKDLQWSSDEKNRTSPKIPVLFKGSCDPENIHFSRIHTI